MALSPSLTLLIGALVCGYLATASFLVGWLTSNHEAAWLGVVLLLLAIALVLA